MSGFKKTSSIHRKLLIPFIVLVVIMSCASIGLSLFSMTDLVDKYTRSDLKKETVFVQQYVANIVKSMEFLNYMVPNLYPLSPGVIKSQAKRQSHDIQYFNWDKLRIYLNINQLSKAQKLEYRDDILKAKEGKGSVRAFIYNNGVSHVLTVSAVSARKKGKDFNPIISEFKLDNQSVSNMKMDENSSISFFYYDTKKQYTQLIAATSKILEGPLLQQQIKDVIYDSYASSPPKLEGFFELSRGKYTGLFIRNKWAPHLFTIVIKENKEAFYTKLKIVSGTFFVLFIMFICIYLVYSLIIRKITASLDVLSSVSEKVANGDLHQQVYLDSQDEIGALSSTFNKMIQNLKESSQGLLIEKERSEAILSSIPEGIIVTDMDNRLIFANKKAEESFNFSNNEVQGKSLLEFIHNEDLMTILNEKLKQSHKPIHREVTIHDEEGEHKIFSLMSSFVEGRKGKAIGAITILRDLTHEREVEELKDGFLRTVSHELRTPLTSVIGFIEVVMGKIKNQKQKEYLTTALTEATALKTLIDDLLDLSQIKAGKMKLITTDVTLKELIDQIVTTLKPLAKGKKLRLSSKIKDNDFVITADQTKLRRIILNLVSNAIKFTEKGSINIDCKTETDRYVFSIKDTGIGLMDDEMELIFEKFRQIDYSSTREFEGIGLGLSIVKQLVEMHGGEIWVESEYGTGSTFYFSIPLKITG